jgi:hypothetical protein
MFPGVSIPIFDYVVPTYDSGWNLTQLAYYTGGSGGTLVATLVVTYNSWGNVSTAIYHNGSSSGSVIATLTATYDSYQNLISFARS